MIFQIYKTVDEFECMLKTQVVWPALLSGLIQQNAFNKLYPDTANKCR